MVTTNTRASDEAGLAGVIGELEESLHDLSVKMGLCWWERYTGSGTASDDLDALERRRSEILLDPALSQTIQHWSGRVSDPVLGRKLEVLAESVLSARVSAAPEIFTLQNEIMDRVIRFRPVVFGREVSNAERGRILREEPDRALRREAWMSVAPLSIDVAASTAELMRRRNHLARESGFGSYVDMALSLASLTRSEVVAVIDRLEEASAGTYRSFLTEAAEAEGLGEVEPWDVSYLIHKASDVPTDPFPAGRIVPSLEEFARAFGQDPDRLGIRVVVRDIPFGGLCMGIDPPHDVRILANPKDGYSYFNTLFHEYGHGLHAVFAAENPFILRHDPGVFCEAMAQVWGWFTFYPAWLRSLGLDKKVVRRILRTRTFRLMARHRSLAASVIWEYQAYDDPDGDLTTLDAQTEARFLLTTARPVHLWGGGPFPSGYPVYRQNYILADLVAGATHRALRERFGGSVLGNPEVFEALADTYWKPGRSEPWREKLKEFTGRDLDAAAAYEFPQD